MEVKAGEIPAKAAPPPAGDDDSPPNLLIPEDDDDGYPNTPPVLERQDYYMENDDPELELIQNPASIVPLNAWYIPKTPFYLPPKLRRINPSRVAPHSPLLLLDLICVFCQRVCNETYAVPCYADHRFCKECIMPRYERHKYCPRCGDSLKKAPQPDKEYDKIIEMIRYDKSKVNFVKIEPESEISSTDTSDDDSDYAIPQKNGKPQVPPPKLTNAEFRIQLKATLDAYIRRSTKKKAPATGSSGSDADNEEEVIPFKKSGIVIPPDEPPPYARMMVHKLKEKELEAAPRNIIVEQTLGIRNPDPALGVKHITPEDWMKTTESEDYPKYSERFNRTILGRPLQNMVYKTYWFNRDVIWPDNTPPPPPFGLTHEKLKDIHLASKARKKIWGDPFLSKREKKISLHHFLTHDLNENMDLSEFSSSSDDDEPAKQYCPFKFDYPEGYRKPKKDWRRFYEEDGTLKKEVKQILMGPLAKSKFRDVKWKKEWGNPLMLIRESSIKSAVAFDEMKRMYMGSPNNARIGHIQKYVHKKLSFKMNLKPQYVPKRFLVEFYLVEFVAQGSKVNVIKCDEIKEERPTVPIQRGPSPPMPIILQNEAPLKRTLPAMKRPITNYIQSRTIATPAAVSAPIGIRKEPTVREIALRNMEIEKRQQRADKAHAASQKAPYLRIEPESPEYRYKPRGLKTRFTVQQVAPVLRKSDAPGTSASSAPHPASIPGPSASSAPRLVVVPGPSTSAGPRPPMQPAPIPGISAARLPPAAVMRAPGPSTSAATHPQAVTVHSGCRGDPRRQMPTLQVRPGSSGNGQTMSKVVLAPSTSTTAIPWAPTNAAPPLQSHTTPSLSEQNPALACLLSSTKPPERRHSNPQMIIQPNIVEIQQDHRPEFMRTHVPGITVLPNGPVQVYTLPQNNNTRRPSLAEAARAKQHTFSGSSQGPSPSAGGPSSSVPPAAKPASLQGVPPMAAVPIASTRTPPVRSSPPKQPSQPVRTPVKPAPAPPVSAAGTGTTASGTDKIVIMPITNSDSNEIAYVQWNGTSFVPCPNLGNGIVSITPPKPPAGGKPKYLQPISHPGGGTYIQGYQPKTQKPPPPAKVPAQPVMQEAAPQPPRVAGTGTGHFLKKDVKAYIAKHPLCPLSNKTKLSELRKQQGLLKGRRLILFYSIKDLFCPELPILPPKFQFPPLAREVKQMKQEEEERRRQKEEEDEYDEDEEEYYDEMDYEDDDEDEDDDDDDWR